MINVVAKFEIKKDCIDEFLKVALELVKESRKESTCISYTLNQDVLDSNIFTFVECWKDQKAIDEHMNSNHFKKAFFIIDDLKIDFTIKNLVEIH